MRLADAALYVGSAPVAAVYVGSVVASDSDTIRVSVVDLDLGAMTQPEIVILATAVPVGYTMPAASGEGALAFSITQPDANYRLVFTEWEAARNELSGGAHEEILVPLIAVGGWAITGDYALTSVPTSGALNLGGGATIVGVA